MDKIILTKETLKSIFALILAMIWSISGIFYLLISLLVGRWDIPAILFAATAMVQVFLTMIYTQLMKGIKVD
jgi:hypothetical protein